MRKEAVISLLKNIGKDSLQPQKRSDVVLDRIMAHVDILLAQRYQNQRPQLNDGNDLWSHYILPLFGNVPQWSAALSVTMIVVAALVASATPGDKSLYQVKMALERTKANLTSDPTYSAALELQLLENGLGELRVFPMHKEGGEDRVEHMLTQVGEHAVKMKENLQRFDEKGNDPKAALKVALEINDKTAFTHATLKSMEEGMPKNAKQKLAQAANEVEQARLSALRVIITFSDSEEETSGIAGKIVKESLEKEIKNTEDYITLIKSGSNNEMLNIADAEKGLRDAQEALSQGKYTIALNSIIETNDLIKPVSSSEDSESAINNNVEGGVVEGVSTTPIIIDGETTTTESIINEVIIENNTEFLDSSGNQITDDANRINIQIKKTQKIEAQTVKNIEKEEEPEFPVGFDL